MTFLLWKWYLLVYYYSNFVYWRIIIELSFVSIIPSEANINAVTVRYTVPLSRKATTQPTLQSISLCSRPVELCARPAEKQSRSRRLFIRLTQLVTYNHGMDNFETSTLYFEHNNGNKIIKICARLNTTDVFQNSPNKKEISEKSPKFSLFLWSRLYILVLDPKWRTMRGA